MAPPEPDRSAPAPASRPEASKPRGGPGRPSVAEEAPPAAVSEPGNRAGRRSAAEGASPGEAPERPSAREPAREGKPSEPGDAESVQLGDASEPRGGAEDTPPANGAVGADPSASDATGDGDDEPLDGNGGAATTDVQRTAEPSKPSAADAAHGPNERKAYQFGSGPAPVHAGAGAGPGADAGNERTAPTGIVRPLRSLDADDEDVDDASQRSPLDALRHVHELSLDRLLGADPETREARNAKLRRAGTGVGAVALAGVLVYAVFPVRTYLDQRAATDRSQEQIEMLGSANDRLEDRAERLRTDPEIERIAREQYGMVRPGEESYGMLPPPDPTTTTTTSTTAPPSTPDP
jgi:cell division protein FtsB